MAEVMTLDEFVRQAEESAETLTEANCPVYLGYTRRGKDKITLRFPCIDNCEETLRKLNAYRDHEGKISYEGEVEIRPIRQGRFYVAVPRSDSHRAARANQLRRVAEKWS